MHEISIRFATPEKRIFKRLRRCDPNRKNTLENGVSLKFTSQKLPETALEELKTTFSGWHIPIRENAYPIIFEDNPALFLEEFSLTAEAV